MLGNKGRADYIAENYSLCYGEHSNSVSEDSRQISAFVKMAWDNLNIGLKVLLFDGVEKLFQSQLYDLRAISSLDD